MSVSIRVDFSWAGKARSLALKTDELVLGRASECDLVLPFSWISSRHLHVKYDSGAVRAKLIDPDAKASVAGRTLTSDWQLVPDDATFELPSPQPSPLEIRFRLSRRSRDAHVLKKSKDHPVALHEEAFEVQFAEDSPIALEPLFAGAARNGVDNHHGNRSGRRQHSASPAKLVIIAVSIVMLLIAGAFIWNGVQRSKASRAFRADFDLVENNLQQARQLTQTSARTPA